MVRDSVVFYRSFYESIKELPPEQFKACALAILEYGLDGKEPEGNGPEKMAYLLTKPQIDANNRRYQNGTKGGRKKTEVEPESNQTETKPESKPNQIETKPEPNENVKEKDNVKEKENIKTFRPPTAADVEEYAIGKGLKIDAEAFVDFYASKGWLVGKAKMKDWRAAVRNWGRSRRLGGTAEGSRRQELPTKGNRFNNFQQRQYDETFYDGLVFGGKNDRESNHP